MQKLKYLPIFVDVMSGNKNIKQSPRMVFTDYLVRQHKRRTAERFAILDCAMAMTDHFSIEEFSVRLDSQGFHVSTATIYSTLDLLNDCGLVRRHRFGSQGTRYERITSQTNHLHLVCTRCGKVRKVKDLILNQEIANRRYGSFAQSYFSLNIYGLCLTCQKRERKSVAQYNQNAKSSNILSRKKK